MNKPVSHIFSPTRCPSEKELLDYVKGRVAPQNRHDIEAHLADCEMCNDYVEGLSLLSDPDAIQQIVAGLNNEIDFAASKKPQARFLRPRIIMSVAAVLAVLVTVTFVLQHQLKRETGNQQTAEQSIEETTAQLEMSPAEETTEESIKTNHGGKNAPPLIADQTEEDAPVYRTTTTANGSSATSSDNKNVEAYYDITLADDDIDDVVMAEVTVDSETTDFKEEEEGDKTAKTETNYVTVTGGVVEKDEVVSQNRTAKESGKKDSAKTESQAPSSAGDQPDEGVLMYENGQYQKSLNYFETILKTSPEDQRAQWYYALNLIKLQRTEEAKVLLQTIINNNGDYKKPAEKELKKL